MKHVIMGPFIRWNVRNAECRPGPSTRLMRRSPSGIKQCRNAGRGPGKMKTIDEVIEAQERCGTYPNCHFCYLHSGPMCEWIRDALHYLKEYRETVTKCNGMRTGTWVPVDSGTVNGRCSVCGYESHLYENDVYGEHYCPNCGAWVRFE